MIASQQNGNKIRKYLGGQVQGRYLDETGQKLQQRQIQPSNSKNLSISDGNKLAQLKFGSPVHASPSSPILQSP